MLFNPLRKGKEMKKTLVVALAMAALISGPVLADTPAPKKAGIETADYKWNAQEGEKIEALHKKGDVKSGKDAYELCGACHLPNGAGRPMVPSRNWPDSTPP